MMKLIASVLLALACLNFVSSQEVCTVDKNFDVPDNWINLKSGTECFKQMVKQIQMEFDASYQYLAMGAHFARDTVNRMGAADLFFKAAKEEREHGSKLIEYLLMRGMSEKIYTLIKAPEVRAKVSKDKTDQEYETQVAWTHSVDENGKRMFIETEWSNLAAALKAALNLETTVTHSIRKLIQTCEKSNDGTGENYYHLVDYLTGVYLEEQLHGQRDLAGKLATLSKMMISQDKTGELGEFLFDKTL